MLLEDNISIINWQNQLNSDVVKIGTTVIKNGLKYFPEIHKWNEEYR